jgi:hypothetical protein
MVRFSTTEDGLLKSDWEPLDGTHTIRLDGPDGSKRVFAQILSPPSFTSFPIWADVILDTEAPEVSYTTPKVGSTRDKRQEVSIEVEDGQDPSPVLEWRIGGGVWQPLDSLDFSVELEEGKNTVQVRATDAAGNTATETWTVELSSSIVSFLGQPVALATVVVVVLAAVVAVMYWRRRRR